MSGFVRFRPGGISRSSNFSSATPAAFDPELAHRLIGECVAEVSAEYIPGTYSADIFAEFDRQLLEAINARSIEAVEAACSEFREAMKARAT